MPERSLIFNAKGAHIAYIEGDRAFDLTGRERCKYARATGNLSELNGEKIVGYVSLDSTFVGLSWIADELFGKPSGEVHPDRILLGKQPRHQLPKNADLLRSEKSSMKEPNDVSPSLQTAAALQPENIIVHPPAVSKSGEDPETGSNTSESVMDEMPLSQGELTVGAADPSKSSSSENELLGRAIGMIRSALNQGGC